MKLVFRILEGEHSDIQLGFSPIPFVAFSVRIFQHVMWLDQPIKIKWRVAYTLYKYQIRFVSSLQMTEIDFSTDAKAATLMASFIKGDTVTDLCFIEGKDKAGRTPKFTFECEGLGAVNVSDYGHSVLCKIISADNVTMMESFEDAAAGFLAEGLEFKHFVREDKFFMKLPFKNDKYRAAIDPTFVPSQQDKSPFHQGSTVQVEFSVSMWINYSSATAGLFLNVHKVVVDGGKKKLVRRR